MNTDIDLALSILCRMADHGQTLNCKEIAEVCGCSSVRIQQIARSGLKKIQKTPRLAQQLKDYQ